jgi:hypothetical protein
METDKTDVVGETTSSAKDETDEPLPYPWPVPRRSRSYLTPAAWVADGGAWPDGPFSAEAPAVVAYAVHWARTLDAALEGVNRSRLCETIEIRRDTLYDLLNGGTWGDTITLMKLERELGITLWPPEPPSLPTRV